MYSDILPSIEYVPWFVDAETEKKKRKMIRMMAKRRKKLYVFDVSMVLVICTTHPIVSNFILTFQPSNQ